MAKKIDTVHDTVYAPFNNSPVKNRVALLERMYTRILTELSVNRFKWVGLPDTVDERFLELSLFRQALSVFYFDDDFDRYMALKASGSGKINMYDNPTSFTVTGNSMVNKTLKGNECVPIWGNFLRTPDYDIVYIYATKLAQIDRTIEINLDGMRYTHLVAVEENQRQTLVNIMRQHREGQPIIFGTQAMSNLGEQVQAFNLGIDKDVVLNLQISKSRLWNECMTLLGIDNANQDKRERLVSDEVAANNEQVTSARGVALNSRKMAVEQINRMYGLSVDVGWNPQSDAMAGQYANTAGIVRGIGDGNVYTEVN